MSSSTGMLNFFKNEGYYYDKDLHDDYELFLKDINY